MSRSTGQRRTELAPLRSVHRDDGSCTFPAQPPSAVRLPPGPAARLSAVALAGRRAQQAAPRISTTDLGGVTLLQGAGCNVIAMPGKDGALMIDGGLATNADALLAAVKSATGSPRIHTLINTHWHPEQTGANEAVGQGGGVIFAHEKTRMYLSNSGLLRHVQGPSARSAPGCPTDSDHAR